MAPDLEHLDAAGVLEYAVERFHPRLTVACSFQKEASVVLDLVLRVAPDARVFTLDTHVLFPETYETWKRFEARYGIEVAVFEGPSLGRQAALHGERLWDREPDACCGLRKVE
ncbi:MAG: phosphoadenosine phosphosulfate reductase family protein, partial [Actinobacteria bacterium]|nr:phosphoadenosine phosphosulfate reductase family protein [Actinomycetota bacterium]